MVAKSTKGVIAEATAAALNEWNKTHSVEWTPGENWTNVSTEFETFVNKTLFPKIMETWDSTTKLFNRFEFAAKEVQGVGQLSEEYVIADAVPSTLDLSQEATLMLERNYPKMVTKLYREGLVKKLKFTLNNNDERLNFSTLGDALGYVGSVMQKQFSNINVNEERLIKSMLVDYANTQVTNPKQNVSVTSIDDMAHAINKGIMDLNDQVPYFNEANKASGGELVEYTTTTPLERVMILTTTEIKARLLDTILANTFHKQGIDITDHIIAFSDLGGAWRTTDDVTITTQATLDKMHAMGDYQTKMGNIVPKGSVFAWAIGSTADFTDKVEEIKPTVTGDDGDMWAMVFDAKALGYNRFTKGMIKPPFYNGEFDEVTHWIHYYTQKFVRPFYNKMVIHG